MTQLKEMINRTAALGPLSLGAGVAAAVLAAAAISHAAPKTKSVPISIRDVVTVWHRRADGNSYFNARLRAELRSQGLRFVPDAASADAILDSQGQYTAGGFKGKMIFRDRAGRTLWAQNVFRPNNSSVMAFEQLGQSLRAQRR
ncbi:MAG TPA: hypothetical protein VF627_14015 [Abditibacterium sp.]